MTCVINESGSLLALCWGKCQQFMENSTSRGFHGRGIYIVHEENTVYVRKEITKGERRSCPQAGILGAVLGLICLLAPAVYAAPINYAIDNGNFSGTFTLDVALPTPFTNWAITPLGGPLFDDELSAGIAVGFNGLSVLLRPTLLHQDGVTSFVFEVNGLGYFAQWAPGAGDGPVRGPGTISVVSAQVPEPAAAVLLAISLLALAGSRWLPRQSERQQLG